MLFFSQWIWVEVSLYLLSMCYTGPSPSGFPLGCVELGPCAGSPQIPGRARHGQFARPLSWVRNYLAYVGFFQAFIFCSSNKKGRRPSLGWGRASRTWASPQDPGLLDGFVCCVRVGVFCSSYEFIHFFFIIYSSLIRWFLFSLQDEILRNAVERFNGKNWKKIGNIFKLTILQLHYHVKQIR